MTFDDGFREMHHVVAPILREQGVPAVFFLTTSVIDNRELCVSAKTSLLIGALALLKDPLANREISGLLSNVEVNGTDLPSRIRSIGSKQRHLLDKLGSALGCDFAAYAASAQPYVTSAQIKDLMRQGFAIGAHSVDHPLYSELTLEEQLVQTRESLGWLSDRFQYECQAFAFPYRDTCVSPEFFRSAFADGHLKISFGTGGMARHFYPKNLERFTMEVGDFNAAQILAREFGVTVLRSPRPAA